MFGAPQGLKEQEDNPDDVIAPVISNLFKSRSSRKKRVKGSTKKKGKRVQINDWWYGEVIRWRLSACYFWLAMFFITIYFLFIYPTSMLSFYNTILLFMCSCLVMFGQQTLRSS